MDKNNELTEFGYYEKSVDYIAKGANEIIAVSPVSTEVYQKTYQDYSVFFDIDLTHNSSKQLDVLRTLVLAGDKEITKEIKNEPLLQSVAGKSNIQAIKHLLSVGVNVNSRDEFGRTPLHWVAMRTEKDSHEFTAELLLKKGANILAKDNEGRTPVDYLFGFEKKQRNPGVQDLFVREMIRPIEPLKIWMNDHPGSSTQEGSEVRRVVQRKAEGIKKFNMIVAIFLYILLTVLVITFGYFIGTCARKYSLSKGDCV